MTKFQKRLTKQVQPTLVSRAADARAVIMPKRQFIDCMACGFFVLLAICLSPVPARGQADPLKVTWEEKIKVASGGGYKGPWDMNESNFDYADDPTVAINAQGIVAVAWTDNARKDIFFQCYTSDGNARLIHGDMTDATRLR